MPWALEEPGASSAPDGTAGGAGVAEGTDYLSFLLVKSLPSKLRAHSFEALREESYIFLLGALELWGSEMANLLED